MANGTKDVWLKVLIGFIITVLGVTITAGFASMNRIDEKKVDKEVFSQHETYQAQQYTDIKDSLTRIEGKIK